VRAESKEEIVTARGAGGMSPRLASGFPLLCKEGIGEVEAWDSTPPSLPLQRGGEDSRIAMVRYEHLPIYKKTAMDLTP
jgi:hypothetical protein